MCNFNKFVKTKGVHCDSKFDLWYHVGCLGMEPTEYESLAHPDAKRFCEKCTLRDSNQLLTSEIASLTEEIVALQTDMVE